MNESLVVLHVAHNCMFGSADNIVEVLLEDSDVSMKLYQPLRLCGQVLLESCVLLDLSFEDIIGIIAAHGSQLGFGHCQTTNIIFLGDEKRSLILYYSLVFLNSMLPHLQILGLDLLHYEAFPLQLLIFLRQNVDLIHQMFKCLDVR